MGAPVLVDFQRLAEDLQRAEAAEPSVNDSDALGAALVILAKHLAGNFAAALAQLERRVADIEAGK